MTVRQTGTNGTAGEGPTTVGRSRTRRRSASVSLGMTAVLATALLGCGGPDEQSSGGQQYSGDDGYGAVCVEEDTQLRVDDDRCDDDYGGGVLAWYYLPFGSRVGAVGQRVSGGSFALPAGAQASRGGVPRDGGVVSRGGFGGKPGSFGGLRARVQRYDAQPRKDWRGIVEGQGLTYAVDRAENGDERPYWHEAAAYEFSEGEIEYLEGATEELHAMALEAGRRMAEDRGILARLGLPPAAAELMRAGLSEVDPPTLYGRFDLAYGGSEVGPAKLLEYNADTPAGLVEAAVTQWYWLEDVAPERDQWNTLHERLVQAWKGAKPRIPDWVVHFAVGAKEPNEDWATVAYLRDTAREAGLIDLGVTMEEIGWHREKGTFVDPAGLPIKTCFKMYPWEWMLGEDFGRHVLSGSSSTVWIEPIWKALLGSKALLPVLWEMFPGHENLLPAYFDGPHGMDRYVTKPMFGWEGAGVRIVLDGDEVEARPEGQAAGQEKVYQRFADLPDFGGNHPVLGTWIVGGHAAGLGVRESDGLVTDAEARFVPHFMDAPRSTPEQVAAWLAEDEPRTTNGGDER